MTKYIIISQEYIVRFSPLCKAGGVAFELIQCKEILPHGGAKIQDCWANHKVETTKGSFFRREIFHISCQDPLYQALVALGLGQKIQINVMSTLVMEEIKDAFLNSFYSACKDQPACGWEKLLYLDTLMLGFGLVQPQKTLVFRIRAISF